MEIVLIEAETPDSFRHPELKVRAIISTKCKKTIHYKALADGEEVAFVSLDRWPETEFNHMVVYEIFVPRSLRCKGFGRAALAEAERIARIEGFKKIRLRPLPLDQKISKEELTEWYIRRGYEKDNLIADGLEKTLKPIKEKLGVSTPLSFATSQSEKTAVNR